MRKLTPNVVILLALFVVVMLSPLALKVAATTTGWATLNDNVYFNDGNVGIGTNSPSALLEVQTNLSTASAPTKVAEIYDGDGEFSKLWYANDVFVQGNYAFVTGVNDHAMTIMDISNPADPDLVSEVYDGDGEFTRLEYPKDVYVSGNYAYVIAENGMTIIDVTDKADPDQMATIYDNDGTYNLLSGATEVVVDGNYAYIVTYTDSSLVVVDISNPASPVKRAEVYDDDGEFNKLGQAIQIAKSGNYVYVGSESENAVTVIDVTTATNPNKVAEVYNGDGEFTKLVSPRELVIVENNLFVPCSAGGANYSIVTMDISTPSDPDLVSEVYDGDGEFDGKLSGIMGAAYDRGYLYVSTSDTHAVSVVDMSNPSDPDYITQIKNASGSFTRITCPREVAVYGDYLIIAAQQGQAVIFARIAQDYTTLAATAEGNVGIGTNSPAATLDVQGYMRLKPYSSAPVTCGTSYDGAIAVTSGYRTCICKGSTGWVYTSDGSTSCSW